MVDYDVLGLDVAVHDAEGVRVVQPLEDLVDVEAAIPGLEEFEERAVLGLVDVLEDQAVDLALLDDVQQFDGVVPAPKRHEDLHLPVYLLELDCVGPLLLGFSILTTQRCELCRLSERNTSLYLPRPILRSQT